MKPITKRLFAFVLAAVLTLSGLSLAQPEAQAIWYGSEEPKDTDIVDYYADYEYEVMLLYDGSVRAQGEDSTLASELNQWRDVVKLRCSYGYVAAVDLGGNVLSFGFPEHVAEALSTWYDLYDIYIGTSYILGLRMDGRVFYCPYYYDSETLAWMDQVAGWVDVEQIILSETSAVAVNIDGQVYTLGAGSYTNQPGFYPESIRDALLVWSCEWICFCLHRDGRISFWGIDERNYDPGILAREQLRSILPGDTRSVGIRYDGSAVLLGLDCPDQNFSRMVNSCRDIDACFYSAHSGNTGLYVVHNGGRVEVILQEGSYQGEKLKPEVESWNDVTQLRADTMYVCGLKPDGTLRVASAYPNSLAYSPGGSEADTYYMPASALGPQSWSEPGYTMSAATQYTDMYHCYGYTAALRSDGTVYVADGNENAMTELSQWRDVEVLEGFSHMLAGITKDGRVLTFNFREDLAAQLSTWRDIRQIFFWNDFAIGLKTDGSMILAKDGGESYFDDLDLEEVLSWKNISYIKGLTCPMRPSLVALGRDGRVYSLDSEHYDDLMESGYEDVCCLHEEIYDGIAVSTNGYINHCIRANGTIVSWGPDYYLLDPSKLTEGNYVYAIGTVGLKSDGSLRYLGHEDAAREKSRLQAAVENCHGVKNVIYGGEGYYALMQDGSVEILLPSFYFGDDELNRIEAVVSSWRYADTLEADSDYLFMRDISAGITVFPSLLDGQY